MNGSMLDPLRVTRVGVVLVPERNMASSQRTVCWLGTPCSGLEVGELVFFNDSACPK